MTDPSPALLTPRRLVLAVVRTVLIVLCLLAASLATPARAEGARWTWPTAPPHTVLRPFEAPAHRYAPGHRGIDVLTAGPGAEVRAVEAGTVRFQGSVAGRPVVSIVHADGLVSTYEPVRGAVGTGQVVAAGEVIGTMGAEPTASHCAPRMCLHLGARSGPDYLDPRPLLGIRGPSVLLPWAGGPDASETAGILGRGPASPLAPGGAPPRGAGRAAPLAAGPALPGGPDPVDPPSARVGATAGEEPDHGGAGPGERGPLLPARADPGGVLAV